MKKIFLLIPPTIILATFLTLKVGYCVFERYQYVNSFHPRLAEKVLVRVNEYRVQKELATLTQNPLVCDLATARSVEVVNDFSHTKFLERFSTVGYANYIKSSAFGENLSKYYSTENDIVDAWIKSDAHRKILEGSYQYGCVSCYSDYCVLIASRSI